MMRARLHHSTRARLVVALLLAAVLASCFGARRAGTGRRRAQPSEDVLARLPTRDELLQLRQRTPAETPPDLALEPAATPLAAARLAAARGESIAVPSTGGGGDVELAARACLSAEAMGVPAVVFSECGALLDLAPADARAAAAAMMMSRAAREITDGEQLLAQRAKGWLDACAAARGSCFDLGSLLSEEVIAQARVRGTLDDVRQAARRAGRLLEGDAAGPYRGDDLISFAEAGLAVPLVEDPPYTRAFRWSADDGVFAPGVRGRGGIHVLRYGARGGGDVVVLAHSTRAMRVLVDGQVVLERRRDRPEPLISRAGLHLSKGAHRIEVIVHALGRNDDTAVAFVDDRGQPALEALPKAPERGAGLRTRQLKGAAESLPLPPRRRDLGTLDALLWRHFLARARIGLTVNDERAAADRLIEDFGFAPEALIAAAPTIAEDDELPSRQAWSFAEPLWQRASARAPRAVKPRWALAATLRAQQPERGLELVRALGRDFPAHAPTLRSWIADALEAGLLDEARDAADKLLAVARTPRNLDAAISAFEAVRDTRRVARLKQEREERAPDPTSDAVARRAQRLGDVEGALDALGRAAVAAPHSPALGAYVDALAPHDAKRALEIVEAALQQAPFDPQLARRRAALSWFVHGEDAARTTLRELRHAFPNEGALERIAGELDEPTRWRDRLALGDAVIAARRAGAEPFPGHGAVFLLDDLERSLALDGSSTAIRHWIVELRSKEALDRFGEIDVDDDRVALLRVVKADGRVVEPDIHVGVSDVSLPGLAPGDIVELLSTSTAGTSPFPRSGYETRMLDLMASPALSRRYVFDAPRELIARTGLVPIAENGLPAAEQTELTDENGVARVRYAFALADVAAARPEPFEPSREETARTAGFAYGVDAALWARMRGRALHIAASPTPWLVECARRIAGDGPDDDKLERLFAFVARRIDPGGASDASVVLATGQGQRTPLLLVLARAVGLRVTPIALHMPTQPPPALIDNDAWSLVALSIELPERTAVAVVDRLVVLDGLPRAARDAQVLDVSLARLAREEARIAPLPDTAVEDDGVRVRVELRRPPHGVNDPLTSLVGNVRVDVPAAFADGMRRDVRKAPPDVLKSWVEQALQASLPGVVVEQVLFPNLESAGAPLSFSADVRLALAPLADGTIRFEHLFAQGAAAAFGLAAPLPAALSVAERTRPLLLSSDREVLDVRLALGEGAAFLEAPEALELRAGPVLLSQTAEITDGTLAWRRSLEWETARVSPGDFAAMRPALAELAARLDARAAFVSGATPGL